MERYAAKLLFQFRVVTDGVSNSRRTCEERIVLIPARSAGSALKKAKLAGRKSEHRYRNDEGGSVHFEFVGVLDLLRLGAECETDEVWYDIRDLVRPMERRDALIPSEKDLNAFREERASKRS